MVKTFGMAALVLALRDRRDRPADQQRTGSGRQREV